MVAYLTPDQQVRGSSPLVFIFLYFLKIGIDNYCIPFIIISVANHLYNTTDMILLIRGLNITGFSGPNI